MYGYTVRVKCCSPTPLCTGLFGIGMATGLVSTILVGASRFHLDMIGILLLPVACVVGIPLGVVLWIFIARRLPKVSDVKLLAMAMLGAGFLAFLPWGVKFTWLRSIAYWSIPEYPGSQRVSTEFLGAASSIDLARSVPHHSATCATWTPYANSRVLR